MTNGGRDALNAVIAEDLDIAWVAGLQAAGVRTGDVVNLASAEDRPLLASPDAPLLSEFNVPFTSLGASFIVVAPADLPTEIAQTYADAIAEILNDPESPVHQLADRVFSGPETVQLDDLQELIRRLSDEARIMLAASAE